MEGAKEDLLDMFIVHSTAEIEVLVNSSIYFDMLSLHSYVNIQ